MRLDPKSGQSSIVPRMMGEEGRVICLQHFIFYSEALPVKRMWIESGEGCILTPEGVEGNFTNEAPGKVVFDGVGNAFPADCFVVNTRVSWVRLTGKFKGEIALEIWHAKDGGKTRIYGEGFQRREGRWESPWISLSPGDGRYFLSCEARNAFSVRDLAWEGDLPSPDVRPSFLVSITTFKREDFLLNLIQTLCQDLALRDFNISFLVVDNGETLENAELPEDARLTLVSQPNLGGTGGAMRALRFARSIRADYMVIASDDIIVSPEMLYRMLVMQSLANRPLSVGAVILTLDAPRAVLGQGGLLPETPLSEPTMIHKGWDLDDFATLPDLYLAKNCDYAGWWLMSAPVDSWRFLPPFFLHWDDVLEGILLKKIGVSIVVPASIFLWIDNYRSENIPVWKRYVGMRNALSTLMIIDSGQRPLDVVRSFRESVIRFLGSFDYDLAECCVQSFRDASRGPDWTHRPLEESRWIRTLMTFGPAMEDLSAHLSRAYERSSRRRGRLGGLFGKALYWGALAGVLFFISSKTAPDGGLAFRRVGDYDARKWAGYSQIAVVDDEGRGYLCQRSLKKSGLLLAETTALSIRFLFTHRSVSSAYRKGSECWEKDWNKTFASIEGARNLPEA